MAPLTEEDRILDAISSADDRYTVYSTPGKLAWGGVGLKNIKFVHSRWGRVHYVRGVRPTLPLLGVPGTVTNREKLFLTSRCQLQKSPNFAAQASLKPTVFENFGAKFKLNAGRQSRDSWPGSWSKR